jgi:hypothetical protein
MSHEREMIHVNAYKLVVWKHERVGLFWESKLERKDKVTFDLRRLRIC